jgi:uncharacterized repeat protein (TIGR01451 family)
MTYTLTVSNTGAVDATGVVVTDALPSGAGHVSGGTLVGEDTVRWTSLSIPAGGAEDLRFVITTCQESVVNRHYRVVTSDQGVADPGAGDPVTTTLIAPPGLTAAFTPTLAHVETGDTLTFTDTSITDPGAPPIVAWQWAFGDGGTSDVRHPTHTYTVSGTHVVTLTVTDRCGSTAVTTGTVVAVDVPALEIGKSVTGPLVQGAPFTYTLVVTNTGAGPATNVVVTDALPVDVHHVSGGTLVGNRTVSMTVPTVAPEGGRVSAGFVVTTCQAGVTNEHYRVADSLQKVDSAEGPAVETTLEAPTLAPSFTLSSHLIPVGGSVNFEDATVTNGGPIVAWGWDFDDDTLGAGAAATHVYTQTGTYTVTMTITDTCGFTGTVALALEVGEPRAYLPLILRPGLIYVPLVIEDTGTAP